MLLPRLTLLPLLLLPAPCRGQAATPPPRTLEEAIAEARRLSPTLDVARRERNVALIDARRARPELRPELLATASQTFRAPRVDLPGRADEVVLPGSISRFAVELRQPVYQFGAGDAPGRRARAMEGRAESDFRTAEIDLALEVREAYLHLGRAEALERVAEGGSELARAHAARVRALQERGLQAEIDVLDADRAAAEAAAEVLRAATGRMLARAGVNRLLGRPLESEVNSLSSTLPVEPPAPRAELLRRALELRPEVAALRQQLEAAEAGVRLARASRQPTVLLHAEYALQTETALTPRSGIAAGVSLQLPIFEGLARRLAVQEAEERVEQLRSALRAREQGVELELERERLAMEEGRVRAEAARRGIEFAQKAHELAVLRLELGRTVQTEVLQAALQLQKARADEIGAEYDRRAAHARLLRALGEP